jgi:hypothetical protein
MARRTTQLVSAAHVDSRVTAAVTDDTIEHRKVGIKAIRAVMLCSM